MTFEGILKRAHYIPLGIFILWAVLAVFGCIDGNPSYVGGDAGEQVQVDLLTPPDLMTSIDLARVDLLQLALPDIERGDMAVQPCAIGKLLLGVAEWKRGDIVLCETPLLPEPKDAAGVCGRGWHVCSSVEFTLLNDAFVSTTPFMASLADAGCVATNALGTGHEASSDNVRSDAPGTCGGSRDKSTWGRQDGNGYYGGSAFPHMGVMCCQ